MVYRCINPLDKNVQKYFDLMVMRRLALKYEFNGSILFMGER